MCLPADISVPSSHDIQVTPKSGEDGSSEHNPFYKPQSEDREIGYVYHIILLAPSLWGGSASGYQTIASHSEGEDTNLHPITEKNS